LNKRGVKVYLGQFLGFRGGFLEGLKDLDDGKKPMFLEKIRAASGG